MAVTSLPLETRYHRLENTNRWLAVITGIVIVALLVVLGAQLLPRVAGMTANERVAEKVVLAPNQGASAPTATAFASDAIWVGFDGTVTRGAAAIAAAGTPPGTTITLKGEPVSVGKIVLINFSWSQGSSTGDGAFMFTFDDAGLITNVAQTLTFN